MTGPPGHRNELRALTGARGIAAWFVVLYHIRGAISGVPATGLAILAKGYLAVDFFFLLSGFVIWLTWHDRLRERGAVLFLRKRIARIWPLHLVMLGFGVVLALLLLATGRADPVAFPFWELPVHLLLLQEWGLTDRLSWNVPAWSISAEAAAYLLFPLVLALIDWRRWSTPLLVAVVAALLGGLHLAMRNAASLGTDIPSFGTLRCLVEFGVGSIVAALWFRRPGASPWPWLVSSGALLSLWIVGAKETLIVPAGLAALLMSFALSAERAGNPLEGRTVNWLGRISYATYLGHFLLWRAFKLAFVNDVTTIPPSNIIAFLLLVLASSALLYHLVERPAQRLLARDCSRSPAGQRERETGQVIRQARPSAPPPMQSLPPG